MAVLSKQQYERRNENAAIRMEQNAKAQTLNTGQHEALSWLCKVRHDIHTNQKAIFCVESGDHSKLSRYIDSEIKEKLREVGLKNSLSWNMLDVPDDHFYDKPEDEGGFNLDYDTAYETCIRFLEKVNTDIEKYLRSIDEIHGTSYCPTGLTRL